MSTWWGIAMGVAGLVIVGGACWSVLLWRETGSEPGQHATPPGRAARAVARVRQLAGRAPASVLPWGALWPAPGAGCVVQLGGVSANVDQAEDQDEDQADDRPREFSEDGAFRDWLAGEVEQGTETAIPRPGAFGAEEANAATQTVRVQLSHFAVHMERLSAGLVSGDV